MPIIPAIGPKPYARTKNYALMRSGTDWKRLAVPRARTYVSVLLLLRYSVNMQGDDDVALEFGLNGRLTGLCY